MKRLLLGAFLLALSGLCGAVPITISISGTGTGTGTGTLGAQAFTNATFTTGWTTDTSLNTGSGTVLTAANLAPINITGQPAATFSSPGVWIFQNAVMGLSRGGSGLDLIGYWPAGAYSINSGTPFGPSTIPTDTIISQFNAIPTSQGNLTFTAMTNITLQISAAGPVAATPVPTLDGTTLALSLLLLVASGAFLLRRRGTRS